MGLKNVLSRIKRKWKKKPFIKDKRYPTYWFDKALHKQEAYLVQIGSNDGKTGDPLYELLQKNKSWKALFVEPVPYSFKKLQTNYPDTSRFTCENVAIATKKERLKFYWVDSIAKESIPDLPYWFDQLGSFDKGHILKHFDGALEPFIVSAELEGIDLQSLLARNKVRTISILHIDTEGFDWKILSQVNLDKYRPHFILYEYHHLSKEELNASINFLKNKYYIFHVGIDYLAVNRSLPPKIISGMEQHMNKVID